MPWLNIPDNSNRQNLLSFTGINNSICTCVYHIANDTHTHNTHITYIIHCVAYTSHTDTTQIHKYHTYTPHTHCILPSTHHATFPPHVHIYNTYMYIPHILISYITYYIAHTTHTLTLHAYTHHTYTHTDPHAFTRHTCAHTHQNYIAHITQTTSHTQNHSLRPCVKIRESPFPKTCRSW